jgi:uncharacterized protein with NAD-binding domain and iron-sulfur cluster
MLTKGQRGRIAILGGGAGAMAAALALTDRPGWRDDYEVTVYQMGWRLGGKGASGRNAALGQRIEEHGVHIFFGCYENAFRMMRSLYDELAREGLAPGSPFRSWEDAFRPQSVATYMERDGGRWSPWAIAFPAHDGTPGDGRPLPGLWGCVVHLIDWLHGHYERAAHPKVRREAADRSARHPVLGWVHRTIAEVIGRVETSVLGQGPAAPSGATHLHRARELARTLPPDPAEHRSREHHAIAWLLDAFRATLRAVLAPLATHDEAMRRLWILIDLVGGVVAGMLRDGVLYNGLDPLDRHEFRDWLRHQGVGEATLQAPPVTGLYDLAFAYEGGDLDRPNFAAGAALRVALRFVLMYKGRFAYRMNAGMGDAIFAPLYLVLKHRGVGFEFFHKATALRPSADGKLVESIDLEVQATLKDPARGYDPLVDVKGLPCWPDRPRYEQLVEGEELRALGIDLECPSAPWPGAGSRTLRLGRDFDVAVVATSLGPLREIARGLAGASPRWRAMVDRVGTVPTFAMQLWLDRTAEALGWSADEPALVGTYVEPLDTWADMSQVLPAEDWPEALGVANVSYFCGTLPPGGSMDWVRSYCEGYLRKETRPLLPRATSPADPDGLDWSLLVDPAGGEGVARLGAQYFRANLDPSELYVQSLAGTTDARLAPGDTDFLNLALAGDWTRGGWNSGCFENAVISGLMAARAIAGHPAIIPGETDFDVDPPARDPEPRP